MRQVGILAMKDDSAREIATDKPSRLERCGHKSAVILGFVWWIIRVIDWAIVPHSGLMRVEFPQYSPEKLKDSKTEDLASSGSNRNNPL